MKPTITVDMLGGLQVRAGDIVVLENAPKVNKPWQVFCYLVLSREAPTPPHRLLQALWSDENLADPGNVLKNTVYALRREFKNIEGECGNPVLFEGGGYICNPAIRFDVDAEIFEAVVNSSKDKKENAKLALLEQAAGLYKGDLLPQLAEDVWVMTRAIYFKKLYNECVNELCGILHERGRFVEQLAVAKAAGRHDPLEEDYFLHMFRALFNLGMNRVIVPIYQKTNRVFTEELGTGLGPELREIYAAASERINPIEQDIMIIKDDLREVNYDNAPMGGPLYCTYDVFKYLYQMVSRTSERSGAHIIILLLSIQDLAGGVAEDETLAAGMRVVRDGLLTGLLRKSDTVARYSKSQYIVMLNSEQVNGADPVIWRIRQHCTSKLEPLGLKVVFATAEIDTEGM